MITLLKNDTRNNIIINRLIDKQKKDGCIFMSKDDKATHSSIIYDNFKRLNLVDNLINEYGTFHLKIGSKKYEIYTISNYRDNIVYAFIALGNDKIIFPYSIPNFRKSKDFEYFLYAHEHKYLCLYAFDNQCLKIDLSLCKTFTEIFKVIKDFKSNMQLDNNDLAYYKFTNI